MLKVKIKYVTQAKLANATVGKKFATVAATTLEDINHWLTDVGAVTMGYKADGTKFVASIAFFNPSQVTQRS